MKVTYEHNLRIPQSPPENTAKSRASAACRLPKDARTGPPDTHSELKITYKLIKLITKKVIN